MMSRSIINYLIGYASIIIIFLSGCHKIEETESIDRVALVNRHNITMSQIDTLGSLSVGNGEFAYTVDITGMQTFFKDYDRGVPLGTQSNWGWHSMPDNDNYSFDDVAVNYEGCNNQVVPYAVQHSEGRAADATNWLRANPHRLHLGFIGLSIIKSDGSKIELEDIIEPNQTLDLWSGKNI